MKILITHVYSQDNKGDAAILSVIVKQLNKYFDECEIYASVFDDHSKNNWNEKAERLESFHYFILQHKNRIIRYLYALYLIFITILWSLIFRITKKKINIFLSEKVYSLMEHYTTSDIILPTGGGYLQRRNTLYETFMLILNLHPIFIGKILCKPVILYAQSIGPFYNIFQKLMVKFVLNKTDLIIVRENISYKILRNLGIRDSIIKKSVDAGFLFHSDLKINLKKELNIENKENTSLLGITVRNWLNKQKQEIYENEIAKFCDYIIIKHNFNVIFIPQVTADYFNDDDRVVGERILKKMKVKTNVWNIRKKYNHYELKAFYSNLDYLIGTRFHSVIFSLTSHVPVIAIEYEHKTSGIMHDLGLSDQVIKMEEVSAQKLISMLEKLIKNKTQFFNSLNVSITPYLKNAKKTMALVKNKYFELNQR